MNAKSFMEKISLRSLPDSRQRGFAVSPSRRFTELRHNRSAMNQPQSVQQEGRLREIAWAFLRLGSVAFGGAVAHIAMMDAEFVRRRGWLSKEEFVDRVGAVNLLPGPSSTELVIYLGYLRGGVPGLIIAGASFILPSA